MKNNLIHLAYAEILAKRLEEGIPASVISARFRKSWRMQRRTAARIMAEAKKIAAAKKAGTYISPFPVTPDGAKPRVLSPEEILAILRAIIEGRDMRSKTVVTPNGLKTIKTQASHTDMMRCLRTLAEANGHAIKMPQIRNLDILTIYN